jgi:hypothetical protein
LDCSSPVPVLVAFTPFSDASRVVVRLLTVAGPGLYVDFSKFNFQLPSELSAPNAPMAVIDAPMSSFAITLRIFLVLLVVELREGGCVKYSALTADLAKAWVRARLVGTGSG